MKRFNWNKHGKLLAVAVAVWTVLLLGTLIAYAAGSYSDEYSAVSVSVSSTDGVGTYVTAGNGFTVSVAPSSSSSGCGGASYSAQSSSITVTNKADYPSTISYTVEENGSNSGSFQIGSNTESVGDKTAELAPNGTFTITFTSGNSQDANANYKVTFHSNTIKPVTVAAKTGDASMGSASVSPASVTPPGSATFTAVPKSGYEFYRWVDSDGRGVSESNPYTLDNITTDTKLTAEFKEMEQTTVRFVAPKSVSGDRDGGSYTISGSKISGTKTMTVDSTDVSLTDYIASSVTLTATPKSGYSFDGWVDEAGGNLSTDMTWTPTLEDIKGKTVCAQFSSNSVSVLFGPTSSMFPNGYYKVTHDGTTQELPVDSPDYRVNGDRADSVTVEAVPDEDYEFLGWMNSALQPVHYMNPLTQPLAFFEKAGGIFPVFQFTKAKLTFLPVDKGSYTVEVGTNAAESVIEQLTKIDDPDTPVILTLTNTDPDYEFGGWVDGSGTVLSTETTWSTTLRELTGYTETTHEQSGVTVTERSQTNNSVAPSFIWRKTTLTLIPGEHGNMTAGVAGGTAATISTQTNVTELKTASYTLTATPTGEYVFIGWYDRNGMQISSSATITDTFSTLAGYGSITPRFQSAMVTMSISASANGTIRLDGETVNGTKSYSLDSRNTYTLTAEPVEGYMFSSWLDEDNNSLSTQATWTTAPLEGKTIRANYIATGNLAVWDVNGTTYSDLNVAISEAQAAGANKITLANDGKTLPAGTYTIPSGITLLVPRDDAYTVNASEPATQYKYVKPTIFRHFIMASGAKIIVASGGALCVNALVAATDGGNNGSGSPATAAGRIIMQNGSNIEVSGTLYAWGFITAQNATAACGTVTINGNGTVYECFQIADQPGGTAATALNGHGSRTFFFNKYFAQNVEVPMTLHAGATEMVFTNFYIQGERKASAPLIGSSSGLFRLSSGSLTKTYHPNTDRTQYDIDGNALISSITLTINGISMDTASYILPINSNMDIFIHSGQTTLTNEAELKPGVSIKIDKNAELVVSSTVYLHDSSDWKSTYYGPVGQNFATVVYSPTKVASHNMNSDATIDVNGTLTVSGQMYSTASGANVTSTEKTGRVVWTSKPASSNATVVKATKTERTGFTGSVTATESIVMYPLKLHNGDSTYTSTAGSDAGTIYYYCVTHNAWETSHNVTYHSNQSVDQTKTQNITGTEATVADNTWGQTGYTFAGWNTAADGSGDDVAVGTSYHFNTDAIPTDLYAQWTPNKYILTLNPAGGVVSPATATVTYDATYGDAFEDGKLPTPTRTSAHANYRFDGWFTQATGGTAVQSADKVTVTEHTTLYAHWSVTYMVNFVTGEGASTVEPQQVAYNGYVTVPDSVPTKAHYSFEGWYIDEGLESKFDFYTRVTEELTLYAKWEPKIIPTENELTVTLPANRVYNGVAQNVTVAPKSGIEGLGEISVKYYNASGAEVTAASVKNAGTYTYKISVAEGDRYDEATDVVTGTFAINKAPLTVTAKAKTITYGDAPANDGVTYSGFVNSETASVLSGTLAYDYSYAQYGNVGTYDITPKGLTSDNYNIRYVSGELTVSKKTVGLTWGTSTFTYDKQGHAPAATATGLVNSDAIGVTVTGAQINAGMNYTATASALTGDKADNYKLPEANTQSFSITKAPLTITGLGAANKTYDGTATAPVTGTAVLTGLVDGDKVTVTAGNASFASANVGENITVSFSDYGIEGDDAGNYYLSAPPASTTANITAKSVTITTGSASRAYNGTALTNSEVRIDGLATGESVTLTATGTITNVGTTANTYSIEWTNASAANYAVTENLGTLEVTKADPTYTAPEAIANLYYTGSAQALVTAGTANGGTMQYCLTQDGEFTDTIPTGTKAGTYTVYYKVVGDANHNDTAVAGPVNVTISATKVDPEVTAPTAKTDLIYTGSAQELISAGTTTGGTLQYSTDNSTWSTNVPTGTNAGTYTVYYKVVGDADYNDVDTQSISVTIAKASLTVTANDKTITYGEAPTNDGVTYSGFVIGEDKSILGGQLTYTYSYERYGNVGSYTITPAGLTAGNYSISFVNGILTVAQKEVGLTWDTSTFTYDGENHAPTATASGTVNNDAIGITVTGAETNAGSYTATASALTGDKADNYTLPSAKTQSFTINKKDVTITGLSAQNKTYDGNTTATLVTSGATFGGIVDGDELTVTATGTFDNKNVGTNKTVTISGLTLGGTSAGNYTLAASGNQTSTAADITAMTLTVTAHSATKAYDGTALTKDTYSSTALAEGDSIYSVTVTGSQKYVGSSNNVPSEAVIKNADGEDVTANYAIAYVNGTLTVTNRNDTEPDKKYEITVVANSETATYDGTEHSISGFKNLSFEFNGVTYTVSGLSASVSGTDAGSYTTAITGEAIVSDSTGVIVTDQFNVTTENGTLTINKKAATITVDVGQSKTYGETDPALTATVDGLVGSDTLDYTLTRKTGENVGTYAIDVTLGNNPNYEVTPTNGTFTINKATVTVTADNLSKVYGAAEPTLTATLSGLKNGDSVDVLSYTLSREPGNSVGSYAITPAGETEQGNYTVIYKNGEFTITKAETNIVSVSIEGWTYGNTASMPTSSATFGTPVITYAVKSSGEYSSEVPKNAGEYTVKATVAGTTNYAGGEATADFTIAKVTGVTVTVTGHSSALNYDGNAHTVTGYDVEISNPLYTAEDFSFSGSATVSRTDAGTTNMGLAASQFTNTNPNFDTVTFAVTDGFQTIRPINVTVTIVGASNTTTYDGEAHTVTGYTATADNSLYDVDRDFTFSGTDTATQTDIGTANMGLASSQFTNTNPNFAEVTFNVTDGYQTIAGKVVTAAVVLSQAEYTYDGAAKEPGVTVYDGDTVIPASEYTVSYSNHTAAGQATVTVTDKEGGNYSFDEVTASFTINNAPQAAPDTVTGHDETIYGKTDGSITGLSSTMEYSTDGTSYSAIAGDSLTDLSAGTYYIRYAAKTNYNASPATEIVIANGRYLEVRFNSDEGTAVDAQSIAWNGKVTEPAAPTKANYVFKEWQLNGVAYDFSALVTGDFELVAVYDEAVAVIGGTYYASLADALAAAQSGDTITILKNFTIDAAKTEAADRLVITTPVTIDFGEYTMSVPGSLETSSNWAALYVDANTTIRATTGGINCLDKENGEAGTYVFNVRNGATLTIESGSYHGGGTVAQAQLGTIAVTGGTFTATAFDEPYGMNFVFNCVDSAYSAGTAGIEITGGSFVGFDPQNNAAEGEGTRFTPAGYVALDPDGDGTYVVAEGYMATFDPNGGSPAPAEQRIEKGQTFTAPAPERTGYTLTSWQLSGEAYDFTVAATADVALVAEWAPISYTITWQDDDGTVIDRTTVNYGDTPTHDDVSREDDENYHYVFTGWTPTISVVTGETTYTATYDYIARTYSDPKWTWTGSLEDGYTATAEFHTTDEYKLFTFTENAAVTNETTLAETCETAGVETYKATLTFHGTEYTEQTTAVRPALGHDYVYTYAWNAANSRVTARRICQNDRSHTDYEVASTSSEVTKEASCSEEGEITYIARFTKDFFVTQTKVVATPKTHTGTPTWSWLDNETVLLEIRCSNCNELLDTILADVTSEITTEPTCTEKGVRTYTATADYNGESLTDSRTEPVENLAHTLSHVEAVDPTCTKAGNIECWTCENCGKFFSDAEGTTELTAEELVIAATGHTEVIDETVAPTCTKTGVKAYTCTVCGETKTETVAALGHDWSEWTVTTEPTCTEAGEKTRSCPACGETETEVLAALGHDYDDEVVEPTCTERGYTRHTCSRCGDVYENHFVAMLGHNYGTEVTASTCTEQGFTTNICSRCGDSYVDCYVDAIGHSFGGWIQTTAPSCAETGVETRTCMICNETETCDIPALGHDYELIEWEWFGFDSATAHFRCAVCGEAIDAIDDSIESSEMGGIITYYASVIVESIEYNDTRETEAVKLTMPSFTAVGKTDEFNNTDEVKARIINITNSATGQFTVTYPLACTVAYREADGRFVVLEASHVEGNTYAFSCPNGFDESIEIVVVVKGDFNGDGAVSTADYTRMKAIVLSKVDDLPTRTQLLAADLDRNDTISTADYARIKAFVLERVRTLGWDTDVA